MGTSSDRYERVINLISFAAAFFASAIARAADYPVEMAPPPVNGISLLFIGIVLLALEAHLFTFGALGALGVAAFSAGLLIWYSVGGISLGFVIPCIAFFALVAVGLVIVGYRTRTMKFGHGVDSLIGRTGHVMESKAGGGMVSVHGEIWAFEAADAIATGDKVEIVGQTNLVLTVRKSF